MSSLEEENSCTCFARKKVGPLDQWAWPKRQECADLIWKGKKGLAASILSIETLRSGANSEQVTKIVFVCLFLPFSQCKSLHNYRQSVSKALSTIEVVAERCVSFLHMAEFQQCPVLGQKRPEDVVVSDLRVPIDRGVCIVAYLRRPHMRHARRRYRQSLAPGASPSPCAGQGRRSMKQRRPRSGPSGKKHTVLSSA